ncbi:protein prenylyltransferase [Cylindrobasidium torrendii FP15055 ss-10]|uniref:Protein farnesyltransferase/geranylgeranyltransferase type-1 subunit alpha n=1 Tax=Cylindrobasidium torrendii FP15055 ss-10 TaxID=1314674 RepID=A0A0D7BL00_9AGAR|nr:protein prenylyltransferase [Cylindrobasidium torrendii FP15055 ss-10]
MYEDDEPQLFSERPEWKDVTPVYQYENVNPLAPILYSDEYKDATDYLRGVLKTGEKSERVLTLTESVIRLNPAHYTAWQCRYETLIAIGASLEAELRLMDPIAIKHLKNYQVWHHRRLLLTRLGPSAARPELSFLAKSLKVDTKNYHTWSYRQWLLAFFNDEDLWADELDFIEAMIVDDVRNNSAWHHRFFVVWASGVHEGENDRDRVLRREITFTKQNISLAPNNPSAWNYLRGMLEYNKIPFSNFRRFAEPYTQRSVAEDADVVDLENPPPTSQAQLPCPLAIEFLADIYEADGEIPKATELWKSLGDEHDTIRKRRYWEHRVREAAV